VLADVTTVIASFQNLNFLTTQKNSPTIRGHCRQLNGIEFRLCSWQVFAVAQRRMAEQPRLCYNDFLKRESHVATSKKLPALVGLQRRVIPSRMIR
jgi:hypothetical protein